MKLFIKLFFLFFYSISQFLHPTTSLEENLSLSEEAFPIREDEVIIGMDYVITIPSKSSGEILLSSQILDSIFHYKSIESIQDFFIRIQVNRKDYSLVKVFIDDPRQELSFQKTNFLYRISFPKDFFDTNTSKSKMILVFRN